MVLLNIGLIIFFLKDQYEGNSSSR
jgi:hypothetical protein